MVIIINNILLTYPLSHPTEAVALNSMPDLLPVVLKLFGENIIIASDNIVTRTIDISR
jgi:hypothetical protein